MDDDPYYYYYLLLLLILLLPSPDNSTHHWSITWFKVISLFLSLSLSFFPCICVARISHTIWLIES
jgi:hypothetical protein